MKREVERKNPSIWYKNMNSSPGSILHGVLGQVTEPLCNSASFIELKCSHTISSCTRQFLSPTPLSFGVPRFGPGLIALLIL